MNKPIDRRFPLETKEAIWQLVRQLKTFTMPDICLEIAMHPTTIGEYLRSLTKAGYLEKKRIATVQRDDLGQYQARIQYTLVKDAIEPPRVRADGSTVCQGQGRQNMWRTMKILKRFSLADLVACSSTEEHPVSFDEAKTYVRFILRAGYLKKCDDATFQRAVFQLVRWTGPKPPMIQRIKQVWDQNLKKVVWPKGKAGERDG